MSWDDIDQIKFADEVEQVRGLLQARPLDPSEQGAVRGQAEALVRVSRQAGKRQGVIEAFLHEFSLETREGLALMCLAEALLRTPDEATRDRLIAEKIGGADWAAHFGQSDSLLVNASTWGLMLTGKVVDIGEDARENLFGVVRRLIGRVGEPVVRAAVLQAIRIMGEQFVLGRTIEAALRRAGMEGYLCSFDMLGEGARTEADAARYERAYVHAIKVVARLDPGARPENRHGISVKLSALTPRFEATQPRSLDEGLYPRLLRLAQMAADGGINLTIDAEEADRLVPTLKQLDRLMRDPALGPWSGLGIAVQAYQKRAPRVIAGLARSAAETGRRLMVRLVKGAYWDTEIKRAQIDGRPDYPVYTTKAATDLSYLVCAQAMVNAAPHLYSLFATYNAHTLAAVRTMATKAQVAVEFQRLHGMGEALYRGAADYYGGLTVRTYAPVGGHDDLLPYLVRRLLENGANTSFVHSLLDEAVPVEAVVLDPIEAVEAQGPSRHPKIPRPGQLYGAWANSRGLDLSQTREREALVRALQAFAMPEAPNDARPGEIDAAFAAAKQAQPAWDRAGGALRAQTLRRMADALEDQRSDLIALCVKEAGKTLADSIDEVREAADFCRYYAHLAETQFEQTYRLPGPAGETNDLALSGRGVMVAISPWNFPLAIFVGQTAAALAAGNAVLAKPAEQTPRIAQAAVRLFHGAGLDPGLLALTPGDGPSVGAALVQHRDCRGVAFTGSLSTATLINRALALRPGPIVPLVAETGGLNAMFVDTTAQREQVIDDVIRSAFGSAGQRCSALRILFLPHDTADSIIVGLMGAMDALTLGDPADPQTDIGPVIDDAAKTALDLHLGRLQREARRLYQASAPVTGRLFAPVLAEMSSADSLDQEVFGPILHIVRYNPAELEQVAMSLASKDFGLTLGLHSRIEGFARQVRRLVPAGNCYVNRTMTGAVVGVQPFGGEGLSGTGPKAGGPHSLLRFSVERSLTVNIAAQGGDPALLSL